MSSVWGVLVWAPRSPGTYGTGALAPLPVSFPVYLCGGKQALGAHHVNLGSEAAQPTRNTHNFILELSDAPMDPCPVSTGGIQIYPGDPNFVE